MARCEDFPCCGHAAGECPSFNSKGERLCCECGKYVANRSTGICQRCVRMYNRRARQYQFDGTGQDQEAGY